MALQVFSWRPSITNPAVFNTDPTMFKLDMYTALDKLKGMMVAGTVSNPYVINMSIASDQVFLSECTSKSPLIVPLVQTLFDLGVPIIAATGNGSSRVAISWPACLPYVVKVSAVLNTYPSTAFAAYANLAPQSKFPGQAMFLAPGGWNNTPFSGVRSSAPSETSTTNAYRDWGTSFAAPHVAGFYAALKAVDPAFPINALSDFIRNTASASVLVNLCVGQDPPTDCAFPFKLPRWTLVP